LVSVFELCWPIGQGGAGVVWEGRDTTRDRPIAVKILPPFSSAHTTEGFQREVRAAAALDHPNIVQIVDYGFVSNRDARAHPRALTAGSPFLVMELARHGSLKTRPPTTWQCTRRALEGILHGLGHAHARGLIHRDIKPSNVLVNHDRPLLTDFGLAARFENDPNIPERVTRSGTPEYMAPEQYQCRHRDFGPWTDLYALGCLAWTLTTGHPPFTDTGTALEEAHVKGSLPQFRPQFPVPAELVAWLHLLLEKDPYSRFRRAADARAALSAMGNDLHLTPPTTFHRLHRRSVVQPRPPSQWPEPAIRPAQRDQRFFGMRPPPLVGRLTEREGLWQALTAVHHTGHTHAVILRGEAGVGKSRLARDLCHRAEETGSARAIHATHDLVQTHANGIAGMLMRLLNAWGLDRSGVTQRAKQLMTSLGENQPETWVALAEVAHIHSAVSERGRTTVRGNAQRHNIVASLLRRLGADRPTILWIDDAQWGAEALALALALLRSQDPIPTLLVLTVRDPALETRPDEQSLVENLAREEHVEVLTVPPLPEAHQRALLDGLVTLEDDLCSRVARRTRGNPQFAVHLVGDWVDRKILVPTARGCVLPESAEQALPDSVQVVWDGQIERVLAASTKSDEQALEIAACLGQQVDQTEWLRACEQASTTPAPELVEALCRMGLATSHPTGWAFTHSMLRERLLRRTRKMGREVETHRVCAQGLAGLANHSERVGLHLAAAQQPDQALAPLLEAILVRGNRSEFGICRTLIAAYDACIASANLPDDDPRGVEGQLMRAEVLILEGNLLQAAEIVEDIAGHVERHSWRDMGARCWTIRAEIAMRRGKLEASKDLLVQALGQFPSERAPHIQTRLARVYIQLGQLDDAKRAAKEAIRSPLHRRCGHGELAYIAKCQGRLEDAEYHLGQATPAGDEDRYRMAHVHNLQGEIYREKKLFGRAELAYREALAIWKAIGVRNRALYSTLNLGILHLVQGHHAKVPPLVSPVRAEALALKLPNVVAIADIALLAPALAAEQWSTFDHHLGSWTASICKHTLFDTDLALMLQIAANLARGSSQPERAQALFREAATQWSQLGFSENASRCEELAQTTSRPPNSGPRAMYQITGSSV